MLWRGRLNFPNRGANIPSPFWEKLKASPLRKLYTLPPPRYRTEVRKWRRSGWTAQEKHLAEGEERKENVARRKV
jgi:hypothetical protein